MFELEPGNVVWPPRCRELEARQLPAFQLGHPHSSSTSSLSTFCTPLTMPEKLVSTPYPLIDADPYVGRVMRYMRPSDYAVWGGATAAFPAALYFWGV